MQLYFERICAAILDQTNEEYRTAAYASLRSDPALHQLVPYFVQFIAEKVTHNLKTLFVLEQMMYLMMALFDNPSLNISPYVASLVPSVLTCLIGKRLGNPATDSAMAHFALRDLAASLLTLIAKRYGNSASTLKPRIARSCLKALLDSHKPFGTHYGAVLGLGCVSGSAGVRSLILPNLAAYDTVLKQGLEDDANRDQADMVARALFGALQMLENDLPSSHNGKRDLVKDEERLVELLGDFTAQRVLASRKPGLVASILDYDMTL